MRQERKMMQANVTMERPRETLARTRYRSPLSRKELSVGPLRILIAADFSTSVQIAAQVHTIGQFDTRIACSADAALSTAGDFFPNIALISMNLPDLAGYRLASTLRWHVRLPSLRLIALTDDIPNTDRRRALAAGFEQYITLPVENAALEDVLACRVGDHPCALDLRRPRLLPK
jgi:PleD family two-component response regulator